MNKLTQIGMKYACDKVDIHHTYRNETYLDVYEKYFDKFRDKKINFLELGVREGASIKIWKDYFTDVNIVGVDIMERCKNIFIGYPNIHIEIGSQGDEKFINSIIEKYGPFDIILDDASHINQLSIKSFELLQNSLNSDGYYIIEDLRNSYENLTEDVKQWPGMHLNNDINFDNSITRKDLDNMLLSKIKDIDYRKSNFKSVHFHSQMVILEK